MNVKKAVSGGGPGTTHGFRVLYSEIRSCMSAWRILDKVIFKGIGSENLNMPHIQQRFRIPRSDNTRHTGEGGSARTAALRIRTM